MNAQITCFVVNSKSHRVARHGSWLAQIAPNMPGVHELHLDDFDSLPGKIETLARAGVTRFCVEGGDGTVLALLSACDLCADAFAAPPQFAILAGGSTNLAYKLLGLRARSPQAAERQLSATGSGNGPRLITQSALHIDADSLDRPMTGFLLSTGTLARAMRFVQTEFHGEGHRGSFAVAEAIYRFLTAPYKYLAADGKPVLRDSDMSMSLGQTQLNGPHCLSLMTSLPRLSLGLNPFWGTGSGGIALTYAGWPVQQFRRGLFGALFRKNSHRLRAAGFESHRTDSLHFVTDGPVMVDGELLDIAPGDELRISLSPPIGFLR